MRAVCWLLPVGTGTGTGLGLGLGLGLLGLRLHVGLGLGLVLPADLGLLLGTGLLLRLGLGPGLRLGLKLVLVLGLGLGLVMELRLVMGLEVLKEVPSFSQVGLNQAPCHAWGGLGTVGANLVPPKKSVFLHLQELKEGRIRDCAPDSRQRAHALQRRPMPI